MIPHYKDADAVKQEKNIDHFLNKCWFAVCKKSIIVQQVSRPPELESSGGALDTCCTIIDFWQTGNQKINCRCCSNAGNTSAQKKCIRGSYMGCFWARYTHIVKYWTVANSTVVFWHEGAQLTKAGYLIKQQQQQQEQ